MNVFTFENTIFDGDVERLFLSYLLDSKLLSKDATKTLKECLSLPDELFLSRSKHIYWICKEIDDFNDFLEGFWDKNQCKIKEFYKKIKSEDDIVLSEAPSFILAPIKKRLGIKTLFGTELNNDLPNKEIKRDSFALILLNNKVNKIRRIKEIFPNKNFDCFYGSSTDDSSLAKLAKKAYKVIGEKINSWDFNNQVSPGDYESNLEFINDVFKVLVLSDIQIARDDLKRGGIFDETFLLIDKLVSQCKPDLIILNGDQVYDGEKETLIAICEKLNAYKIPWAPSFGNHDQILWPGYDHLSILEQFCLYESYSNCLFKKGPNNLMNYPSGEIGYGNYVINLLNINKIVRKLIIVNSGSIALLDGKEVYAHLSDQQIEFINNISKDCLSTLFTHIPLFAYSKAINNIIDKSKIYGNFEEHISSYPKEDNVFERINNGKLDSIIACHDHNNSFIIPYKGVTLAYSLKTGKGCYYKEGMIGGTLLNIKKDGSIIIEHIYGNN